MHRLNYSAIMVMIIEWIPCIRSSMDSDQFSVGISWLNHFEVWIFYPLMSHILRLNERKTNGSFENVKDILQEEKWFEKFILNWGLIRKFLFAYFSQIYTIEFSLAMACVILAILIAIIFSIVACRHSRQVIYIERPVSLSFVK